MEASNRKLNDEVAQLRQQIHSTSRIEDFSQLQKEALEEQVANLAAELKLTTAKLEQSQARLTELDVAATPSTLAAESASTDAKNELETKAAALQKELAESREKLLAFDTINRQLLDLEQRYEQTRLDNQRLQAEITRWRERLADSEEAERRLDTVRPRRDDSQTKIGTPSHSHRNDLARMAGPLEIAPNTRPTAVAMGGLAHYDETAALEAARAHVDAGRHEEALRHLDEVLRNTPDNREARLFHLLASVRLYRADAYEAQIEAIKNISDLSDNERRLARDLFLARADSAQKRGRDDDMLRYRNWAKSVVYHMPFGNEDSPTSPHGSGDSKRNGDPSAAANGPTHTTAASTAAAGMNCGPVVGESATATSPSRSLVMGFGLAVSVILLVNTLFGTSAENPGAPVKASAPSPAPIKNQNIQKTRSKTNMLAAVHSKAASVAAIPQEDNSRTQSKNDRREPASTDGSNLYRKQEPAIKRSQSVWGAYSIVKPTQVYSGPSEDSAFIANIDAGIQVNVVSARNGWYEIRSKSGRPPGFIRRETATRIK
jgi:tetratricopeptide (TPR) repeat protein